MGLTGSLSSKTGIDSLGSLRMTSLTLDFMNQGMDHNMKELLERERNTEKVN